MARCRLDRLSERYRPARASWRTFRAAWLSAAAIFQGADGDIVAAVALAQQAFDDMTEAWSALGGKVE